jgi:hypothetical protein
MKVGLNVTSHTLPSTEAHSVPKPELAKQNSSNSADCENAAVKTRATTPEERALLATKTILGKLKIELPKFGGFFKKNSSKHESGSSSSNARHSNVTSTLYERPMFHLKHVPYVSQGNELMGCWYACARMVGHSVEAGPLLGLPELYSPRSGHSGLQHFDDVEKFLQNEGLSKVDLPDSREFSHEELGELLYKHGPIIFGWQTPSHSWHMSVLTGVDSHASSVIFHDPRKGPDITMPLSYFNQRLAWQVPHAMLYR